jgi:hypothetical protein
MVKKLSLSRGAAIFPESPLIYSVGLGYLHIWTMELITFVINHV